jgi:crotonobetainyl-CoA:carnitine CoA-transferase CaiB-like acyl-CoA transferase
MKPPLDGITILDLTRLLPGPYCTMLLADMGADVIKVEEPAQGDYSRWYFPRVGNVSYTHLMLNRNKKSIKLNLKAKEGREVFLKLAKCSDVIVESFRPGVMKKLGVDYNTVKKINPKLIFCSISGFGQDGPYRDIAAHDINYVGMGGILALTGYKGGPPMLPAIPIADLSSAMFAALSITTALLAREKIGRGQYIDISMHDCAISWLVDGAKYYFAEGEVPERGEKRFQGGMAHYNIYQTKDGKYITIGALEQKFWANLCEKIGRKDLIERQPKEGVVDAEIGAILKETFLKKTRDDWMVELMHEDACFAPLYTVDEVFDDEHVKHRKMVVETGHPSLGKIKQIGIPMKFSVTPGKMRKPAPGFGEDTEKILKGIGYSKSRIKILREKGVI